VATHVGLGYPLERDAAAALHSSLRKILTTYL